MRIRNGSMHGALTPDGVLVQSQLEALTTSSLTICYLLGMAPKKDFTQVALDVVRRATGEAPRSDPRAPKQTAPKVPQGAAKKPAKKG